MLSGAVHCRIGFEARHAEHRPARVKSEYFFAFRTQKHVIGKLAAPGVFRHQAKAQMVVGISAGVGPKVAYINVFFLQVSTAFAPEFVKFSGIKRDIDLSPVYFGSGHAVLHDKAVVGRAARKFAGVNYQGSAVGQLAHTFLNRMFCEFFRRKIPISGFVVFKAYGFKASQWIF